jgi:hypothetical protein
MGIYKIKQESMVTWKHEIDLLRAGMIGQPINSETTAALHQRFDLIRKRMSKDILDEVCLPCGGGLYAYRKGWSDKRVAKFINAETDRMMASPNLLLQGSVPLQ